MQKPQHKVTVSRSVTEATEGIPNILSRSGKKSTLRFGVLKNVLENKDENSCDPRRWLFELVLNKNYIETIVQYLEKKFYPIKIKEENVQ